MIDGYRKIVPYKAQNQTTNLQRVQLEGHVLTRTVALSYINQSNIENDVNPRRKVSKFGLIPYNVHWPRLYQYHGHSWGICLRLVQCRTYLSPEVTNQMNPLNFEHEET